MQRGTIQQILKDMRVHGQRVPSAQAVHNLMDIDKLNAPKPLSSQGFLKFCYNKANLERYISKNLGKLIQIDNSIAMGKAISDANQGEPSNPQQFTPRKHGETNASLELLRNDESVRKTIIMTEEQYKRLVVNV